VEKRRVDLIEFAWDTDPPRDYPFLAAWTGGLLAPEYGTYRLYVDASSECTLELDGQVLSLSPAPGKRGQGARIVMAQGVHALYLECLVTEADTVRLMWEVPGSSALSLVPRDALYRAYWPVRGLVGHFYPNDSWSGEPQMARIDRQVAYYFHFLPLSRPYTVEWTGRLVAPISGPYRLGIKAISSASLYIDDKPLIEDSPFGQFVDQEIYLTSGAHDIRVRYLDNASHSQVYLYWQLPEGQRQLIPFDFLLLPEGGAWWVE
jgi:hypothetical protein